MSPPRRIAIVGSTGLLGSAVVEAFLDKRDLFDLTLITRGISTRKPRSDVRTVVVDFEDVSENSTLVQALQGQDVLISTLNSAVAVKLEPRLVQAAIQAGVKRFMPSEYTFDITHSAARSLGDGNLIGERVSWADGLSRIASEGHITYTTLITGGFLDWGLRGGMLGFDLAQQEAVLYEKGEHKATGCTVGFVANAIVASLLLPDAETRNKRIYVAEVEYTGQEVLEVFQHVTGKTWKVTEVSVASTLEEGHQLLAQGNRRGAYVNYAVALNFNGCGAGYLVAGLDFGRTLGSLGLERQSLESIIRQVTRGIPETMGGDHSK
ncbi:hypothetical protein PV08_06121 [Exophiala spinifera]|uniref:NmrA-like domain-containing protein n=1 Tax=Exophiala spinifera TaxID=91928 RepID=A0A0D2BBT9_9EURO|nr:uncharacterized protein PV08_06121 [Exophiala spinifera]KIW16070.1 hypothetical protein PV08_06121 [Exophiala spinifera]